MKKYGILLLTIVCLTSMLTLVFATGTGSPNIQPEPVTAPSPAPDVENAKPENLIQKAENVIEKTEEKIKDAAEKVMEKTEEVIEGKKPEPVKANEETNLKEPAEAGKISDEKAENEAEKTEETPDEIEENAEMNSEEKAEGKTGGKTEGKTEKKDSEDSETDPSDEEEISITEETMDFPETMPDDALLRTCFLHWFCHLNQYAHCWGPNCFFGHTDASSPIRRENFIEEMLPNYCIGVLSSPVPEALAVHFDLRPGEGLWVEHVIPGSPAAEAGIHRGDILLQATVHSEENGEKTKKVFWLNHPILLMDLVEQIGPEEFELTTICCGKEQKIHLRPAERKEMMEKAGILK